MELLLGEDGGVGILTGGGGTADVWGDEETVALLPGDDGGEGILTGRGGRGDGGGDEETVELLRREDRVAGLVGNVLMSSEDTADKRV